MTLYVDAPSRVPIQGIWCYRPAPNDCPDYRCRPAMEGLIITDVTSLQRFFREKCRWSVRRL
jgi:hypothetical protein